MAMYYEIKRYKQENRERIVGGIQRIRRQIAREIPPRTAKQSLLIATWNIRDFDSNKFGHGPRLGESYHYIAEVISAFDIVAVQEVNKDLRPWERVMRLLGPSWRYIATDLTEGRSGNGERIVFVYDSNKVSFENIAGEIVLPQGQTIGDNKQFARTPFLVYFQSGWFKFSLCSVHIYYGKTSGDAYERRVEEIDRIGKFIGKRAKDEDANMILLGDFNVVSPTDRTMKALKKHKWIVPDELSLKTNMRGDKYYDQIAFRTRKNELRLVKDPDYASAGVFNFYKSVFRPKDWETYYNLVPARLRESKWDYDQDDYATDDDAKKRYYTRAWRTWQMSDHLPLWVNLEIDFSDAYLKRLVTA